MEVCHTMKKFIVALLQLLPGKTPEDALQKGVSACRKAKAAGADAALFPEMWSSGYTIPEDIEQLKAEAVPADGPFVQTFGTLAAELDMAIAITFLERYDFSGKTIYPLCTNEGSGLGRSAGDIRKLCPGAQVGEGLSVHGAEAAQSQALIRQWAEKTRG